VIRPGRAELGIDDIELGVHLSCEAGGKWQSRDFLPNSAEQSSRIRVPGLSPADRLVSVDVVDDAGLPAADVERHAV
jgi:hypothetical protein